MPSQASFTLRAAEPRDLPAIVGLIRELAAFEQLSHLVQTTPEALHPHLFGDASGRRSPGGRGRRRVVAFALFFTNFSTFLARPGLYLEDLYVQPAWRGHGIGQALLERLAALAVERGCGRFEWSVLDWNANAIGFYERMGATVMPDWRICRVSRRRAGAARAQQGLKRALSAASAPSAFRR